MAQLIATKLTPPRLGRDRILRPRLHAHLAGRDGVVVLVSAPPGFGKSTFVVEWLETQNRPYAWCSLDRFDNEGGVFSEHLAAAVATLTGRDAGPTAVPGHPAPDVRDVVSTLVDDLTDAPARAVVVLDDYHVVDAEAVHEAVAYLVDRLPSHIGLTIVTRTEPSLPLARLRAQGRLVDVRGDDLRFSDADVGAYLHRRLGARPSPETTAAVTRRSEGWIAALQLVALGLEPTDGERLAAALRGEHRHIAGYLLEEVLARLPPALATFVTDTAVLDRFDAALCRRVTTTPDPAAAIDELERRNAFVIALDGGWYRYHHLFSELPRAPAARRPRAGARAAGRGGDRVRRARPARRCGRLRGARRRPRAGRCHRRPARAVVARRRSGGDAAIVAGPLPGQRRPRSRRGHTGAGLVPAVRGQYAGRRRPPRSGRGRTRRSRSHRPLR